MSAVLAQVAKGHWVPVVSDRQVRVLAQVPEEAQSSQCHRLHHRLRLIPDRQFHYRRPRLRLHHRRCRSRIPSLHRSHYRYRRHFPVRSVEAYPCHQPFQYRRFVRAGVATSTYLVHSTAT